MVEVTQLLPTRLIVNAPLLAVILLSLGSDERELGLL